MTTLHLSLAQLVGARQGVHSWRQTQICISSLEITVTPAGQGTSCLALTPCWDSGGPRSPACVLFGTDRDRNHRPWVGQERGAEGQRMAAVWSVRPSSHSRRNT